MSEEIKTCPFCGEAEADRNSDRWGHFYVCNCGARAAYGSTPADALQAWNHRGTLAQRCAECTCDNGGAECHWIKSADETPSRLPCDLWLPPATRLQKGCSLSVLMAALKVREGEPLEFDPAKIKEIREKLAGVPAERAPIGLADIERVIVDYFDAAGFEVVEGNGEWIAHVDDAEVFVTSIAVAVHKAIGVQSPAESADPYFEMLWQWFVERGAIDRDDWRNGKTADEFKSLLDEHELELVAQIPVRSSQPENFEEIASIKNQRDILAGWLEDRDAKIAQLETQVDELGTCLNDFVNKEFVRDETIERAKRALSSAKSETVGEEELTEAIDNCADSLGTAIGTSDIARGLLSHFEVRRK